jgi:hypothetical protein
MDTKQVTLIVGVTRAAPGGCRDGAGQDVTVGRYSGTYLPQSSLLQVCDEHAYISVSVFVDTDGILTVPEPGQPTLSLGQLRDVIEGLTLAPDISDPATWFDATTAIA